MELDEVLAALVAAQVGEAPAWPADVPVRPVPVWAPCEDCRPRPDLMKRAQPSGLCVACERGRRYAAVERFLSGAESAIGQRLPLCAGDFDVSLPAWSCAEWEAEREETERARAELAADEAARAAVPVDRFADAAPLVRELPPAGEALCPCGMTEPSMVRTCQRMAPGCRSPRPW